MEPSSTINEKSSSTRTLILNLDYLGACRGACSGCLLTDQERQSGDPFLEEPHLEKALKEIPHQKTTHEQIHLILAVGRGDTLGLNEAQWCKIFEFARKVKEKISPKQFTLECSTGLIGKIDQRLERALWAIRAFGPELRFVVAANSDAYSKAYWKNVNLFFKTLMQARGGQHKENSGDILVLNLNSDRLPSLQETISRIESYPFPINIAWLPFHLTEKSVREDAARWLLGFYQWANQNKKDCNLVNLSKASISRQPSLWEALNTLEQNRTSVWWFTKETGWFSGAFSPLGDLDFIRLNQKMNMGIQNLSSQMVRKQILTKPTCKTCTYLNPCVESGTFLQGLFSTKSTTQECPNGMNLVFKTITENQRHHNEQS